MVITDWEKEKILILVKTYPNLSKTYDETVCCAGITLDGRWRRIYPVRFRQLPPNQQFKKFQIIEAYVRKSNEKLMRKESFKINDVSIKIVGGLDLNGLSSKKRKEVWEKRNKFILPVLNKSLEELDSLKTNDKTSLGIIKPKKIIEFYRTPLEQCRDWEKDLINGTQRTLFDNTYKTPLDHIPYKFSYKFFCDDSQCTSHDIMCEDWELYQLYREMVKRDGEAIGWQKVKQKYYDWMSERDFYFIMGTEWQFNKFLIIGLYYPPRL